MTRPGKVPTTPPVPMPEPRPSPHAPTVPLASCHLSGGGGAKPCPPEPSLTGSVLASGRALATESPSPLPRALGLLGDTGNTRTRLVRQPERCLPRRVCVSSPNHRDTCHRGGRSCRGGSASSVPTPQAKPGAVPEAAFHRVQQRADRAPTLPSRPGQADAAQLCG